MQEVTGLTSYLKVNMVKVYTQAAAMEIRHFTINCQKSMERKIDT